MEAIILAGGLGTRLRSMVEDVPKSMALIQSRPFLEYQLDQLIANGVSRFIFSVGYKSKAIQDHFSNQYKGCDIVYAVEETLLGTGGAIKNAMNYVNGAHVVVANGDSLLVTDLKAQFDLHIDKSADVTLALKPMKEFERYGTLELDTTGRITKFREKQPVEEGIINGGLYIFNVQSFKNLDLPEKFSVEKDVFEAKINTLKFYGFTTDGYFLDIGIPKDFIRAQYEVGVFPLIDLTWTLFLDRDGVINKKIDDDYVKSIEEFELIPDALKAISNFSKQFGRIVIVTNQQGIGKGIMTEGDLNKVHHFLLEKVNQNNGKIDAIYHAPQLVKENSIMRKPEIGMALQAQKDFPEIDFSKSIMVGDSASDIAFGKRAKMTTILIKKGETNGQYAFETLGGFSQLLNDIL